MDIDIKFFRQRLIALREDIQAVSETGEQAAQVVELDQSMVGRLSRMDAMQAQAMSLETSRRRGIHLQQIEAALIRIDKDDYGRCIDCDEVIAHRRLEFDPATTRCIDCAGKVDA